MTASRLFLSGLLVACLVWLTPPGARADTAITMPLGAQRIISLTGSVARIVIGQPGIVETTVLNDRQVQVVAIHPGHTSMTLFTDGAAQGDAYAVNVLGDTPQQTTTAPAAPSGPSVTQIVRQQPDLRGIHMNADGDSTIITGNTPDLEAAARAAAIAKSTGKPVVDLSYVNGEQMVAVDINFAAVSVTTMRELGFNFQSLGHGIQGALTSPSTVSSFGMGGGGTGLALATSLPIQSAFNLFLASPQSNALGLVSVLSSSGLMQLLAEPTLMVRSGDRATFMAGGEIPVPVPQAGVGGSATITIEYHPYGVRLRIAPVVLSNRRILLQVAPEVSEIDNTNAVSILGTTVPAFRTRSTSTTVELGDGQSYMLAGLIYNNDSFVENKIPFLGDLPIIGNFFKNTQNSKERQELIVIATPHLVGPLDSRSMPALPGAATASYSPGFGDILLNAQPLDRVVRDYGLTR
jgi:pilus assembly protein CpaC